MPEGKENGIKSRISATSQSAKNVFFGTRLIARARITMIARIITAPATLIFNKLIPVTSFQLPDDLLELFDLLGGEFLPSQQRCKQLIRRTVIDFVDQLVCFRLLYGGFRD